MSRRSAIVVVLALLVAVGACGSEENQPTVDADGTAEDLAVVAAAPDRTAEGASARTDAVVAVSADGEQFTQEMEGVVDFTTGAGQMRMTNSLNPFEFEFLGVDAATGFWRIGDILDLPEGKEWVLVTADDLGVAPEEALGGVDPGDGLAFLRGVVENPRVGGRQEIRGESTQRFEVGIDLDALLKQFAEQAGELSPTFEEGVEQLKDAVRGPVEGEVWIDDAGRVRRFRYVVDYEVEGFEIATATRIDYFDFGVPVEVVAPPPDQVVPFADVRDQIQALVEGRVPAPTS
jgi:hypothetical protein